MCARTKGHTASSHCSSAVMVSRSRRGYQPVGVLVMGGHFLMPGSRTALTFQWLSDLSMVDADTRTQLVACWRSVSDTGGLSEKLLASPNRRGRWTLLAPAYGFL